MNSNFLRKLRIVLAVIVFLSIFLSFIDFRFFIPDKWFSIILFLQFTPSVLNFINAPVIAAVGFFVILALTVFTGRSYCSVICPLGVYQDVVSRLGGRVRKRNRRYGFRRPDTILRYSILSLVLILLLAGSVFLLGLLDPYSIFGRFSTYILQPAIIAINNVLASVFSWFDNYTIFKVESVKIPFIAYILPLILIGLVTYLSFTRGRLYCNSVCPVGTFLGLISKVSLFRIKINQETCSHCGRCAINCKSSCIDFLREDIDVSRCVVCFNCISSCNDNAISFGIGKLKTGVSDEPVNKDKRKFIAGIITGLVTTTGIIKAQDAPVPTKNSTVAEDKKYPVCPPGAISIEHFTKFCTACSLCVSACPKKVIIPSVMEYGLAGIMQPHMDFHKNFCNFECIRCTEVCPTGALLPLTVEAKKLTQLGKVNFLEDNCIVKTEKTDCGACSEHCPTKAVYMVPYEGSLVIPEINDEICIGCGACEFACPTIPYKAIFVDGNPVHLDALKPEVEELNQKSLEEFPF